MRSDFAAFVKAIRATSMIWKWRGGGKVRVASAHHEGVELVAVGIAEIGGVEIFIALPGGAFAAAAERQSELVDAVDISLFLRRECRHHAVADRHRLAVIGKRDAESGAAARPAPGDEMIVGHEPSHAQFAANLVIKRSSLLQIAGAYRDVTDHDFPPSEHSGMIGFAAGRLSVQADR